MPLGVNSVDVESVRGFFTRDVLDVCLPRFELSLVFDALAALASAVFLALSSAFFFLSSAFFLASSSRSLFLSSFSFFFLSLSSASFFFLSSFSLSKDRISELVSTRAPVFTRLFVDLDLGITGISEGFTKYLLMMLLESNVVGEPLLIVADDGEALSLFEGVQGDIEVLLVIDGDFCWHTEAELSWDSGADLLAEVILDEALGDDEFVPAEGLLLVVVKGECLLAEVILADAVKGEFFLAKVTLVEALVSELVLSEVVEVVTVEAVEGEHEVILVVVETAEGKQGVWLVDSVGNVIESELDKVVHVAE